MIVSEATYIMGDGETPSFAEAMVLQKAKQAALEEAGTYIESYTKVHNLDLTTEEIRTLTGGIIKVDVLDKKRTLVSDGLRMSVKIKAIVTTDRMEELARRLKGKDLVQEHRKLQEDYSKLTKEVEFLKSVIARPQSSSSEKTNAQDQLREQEKSFASIQRREGVFYERLIAGDEVFAKASQQLEEKKTRAESQKVIVDSIYEDIVQRGHEIIVGEPAIDAHKGTADLTFPVVIRADPALSAKIRDMTRSSFGQELNYAIYRKFEQRLDNLSFVLELVLAGGDSFACSVPRHLTKFQTNGEFLSIEDQPSNWNIRISVPIEMTRRITSIRGSFAEGALGSLCGVTRNEQ
jgi:hypothetical protein